MPASTPPLELQAASGGVTLPLPRLESMTRDQIRDLPFGPSVTLVVKNKDGQYESLGVDISLALARAASPIIDLAFAELPPDVHITKLCMPHNDKMAYKELFSTILRGRGAGRLIDVARVEDEPLMAYHRMRIAALNLAMSGIADNLETRSNNILNPNLHEVYLRITPLDVKSIFRLFPKSHGLQMAVTDAIGRGLACRSVHTHVFYEINQLLNEDKVIREAILTAKKTWEDKWMNYEDIYKRQ